MENNNNNNNNNNHFDIKNDVGTIPEIPKGAELLNIQVAGHRFGHSKNKLGLLRHSQSRDILKPICDVRSRKELAFYKSVFSPEYDHDECVRELRQFLPKFNGIFYDASMKLDYLRLADITSVMLNPSLMDLKLGQRTYDPDANPEKIKAELDKYSHVLELGFRILGLRIYNPKTQSYIVKDKDYGLSLTPETVIGALHYYTQNERPLLERFHNELQSIIVWFEQKNLDRWKFYSSSLLFAYGQANMNNNDNANNDDFNDSDRPSILVKMIDFAHVFPNDPTQKHYETAQDTNYLYGLRKLDQYLHLAKTQLTS